MKILVTGIHGYLGTLISAGLRSEQHDVEGIDRKLLYRVHELALEIKNTDVIMNLAGASILQRWTLKNKETIYNSRVQTTKNLVLAINLLEQAERPKLFISASATGIYKSGEVHDESSVSFDDGFLGTLVRDWEAPLNDLPKDIRKVIFRIGPVLGKKSKTISNLKLPFKLGFGGKIASGKQPFPYIHEKDIVKAFTSSLVNNWQGVFNLVAPEQISNLNFTKTFAQILHRPAVIPLPGLALRVLYGEAASMLVDGPQVVPKALLINNFKFKYPDIRSSLTEILA